MAGNETRDFRLRNLQVYSKNIEANISKKMPTVWLDDIFKENAQEILEKWRGEQELRHW